MSAEPELWRKIDDVDIWRFGLNGEVTKTALSTLDTEERARAGQIACAEKRNRYITAHTTLRTILATYINIAPDAIRFTRGPGGKPGVDYPLHFNLSHSHGLALLAISHTEEVGIDIEWCSAARHTAGIANRYFSEEECAYLAAAIDPQARFYELWCAKEAYLKAVGEGIHGGLSATRIIPHAEGEYRVVRAGDADAYRWSVRMLQPGDGYVGAVCAQWVDTST